MVHIVAILKIRENWEKSEFDYDDISNFVNAEAKFTRNGAKNIENLIF